MLTKFFLQAVELRRFVPMGLPLCKNDGAAVLPGQVGELRVHRTGNNLSVDCVELVHTIAECNDLCGADECAAQHTRVYVKNVYTLQHNDKAFVELVPDGTYKSRG